MTVNLHSRLRFCVWLGGIACARQCVRAFVYVFDLTEYYFKDTRSGNIWWPDSAGACIFILFLFFMITSAQVGYTTCITRVLYCRRRKNMPRPMTTGHMTRIEFPQCLLEVLQVCSRAADYGLQE